MKYFIFLNILLISNLISQELQVKADSFHGDQKKGISIFKGNVKVTKGSDKLNASKITIYTDKKNQPTKFVAEGDASFSIVTQEGIPYKGKAQKVIYFPNSKEYHFYKNVYLKELNDKKEIIGDEVVLKTIEGTAYAKGDKSEPVIMIFNIPQDEKKAK